MGELEVTGPGAFASLQGLTPNDVGKLDDGRIQYSAFLTEKGTFVDDLLVYRRAADSYLVVVNASNTPKDFEWATGRADGNVRIEDRSAAYALIAVQGSRSAALLSRLCSPDPSDFRTTGFATRRCGLAVARLADGLHGEGRLRDSMSSEDAERLFRKLSRGSPRARLLRPRSAGHPMLEAKMALYGNTSRHGHSGKGPGVMFRSKGDFMGRDALVAAEAAGVPRRLVGFEMVDRGLARHGYAAKTRRGRRVVTSAPIHRPRQADRSGRCCRCRRRDRHRLPSTSAARAAALVVTPRSTE